MKKTMRNVLGALLALLLCISAVPAVQAGSFTDVTDPVTERNVEVLRMMGVIDGMTDTTFEPNGTLTRAQFCKMAIILLGKSEQVGIYKNYTIFPDVKGSHWAAGYINMAVRGEHRFIAGFTDGTFGPNRTITYGQAITILMRLLGYTDADVGMVWPEGYINAAIRCGVTDGVSHKGSDAVTRAEAAQLFVNLLTANGKDGGRFVDTLGTTVSDVILLNADTQDDTGAAAVLTSEGTYAVAARGASAALTGRKGTLLLNNAGKVVTFIPTNVGESRDIVIATAEADALTDTEGVRYKVYSDTLTYFNGERGSYGTDRVFFRPGSYATVYTGATGKVEYVVVGVLSGSDAVVVAKNGSTEGFAVLTDRTDYKIYKNGAPVSASALRKYDVATYSAANNVIYVSDSRINVYYKNAYPNTAAPTTITVTGISQPLSVLHCAAETLGSFRLGDAMTLLLTQDGRVAGAVAGRVGSSVGYVSGGKIEMFDGVTFDCDMPDNIDSYTGRLVTVSAGSRTKISVSAVSGNAVSGALDVSARTVGITELAANVRIFEKVGGSALTKISLADIPADTVPSAQIAYARKNYAGEIDVLVLDDVTGDRYYYGRMSVGYGTPSESGYAPKAVTVECAGGETFGPYECSAFSEGEWGGVIPEADGVRAAGYVNLRMLRDVPASAWRSAQLLYLDDTAYTVSKDVACYNKVAGAWFDSLSAALAFGGKVNVYVDSNNVVRGMEVVG